MELSLSAISLFGQETNISSSLCNEKRTKLKKHLKTLLENIGNYRLVCIKWAEYPYFKGLILLFSHGIISSICFGVNNQIIDVYHDSYLVNKLASRRVSSMQLNESFIVITYLEQWITIVRLHTSGKSVEHKFKISHKSQCKTIALDNGGSPVRRDLMLLDNVALVWWKKDIFAQRSFTSIQSEQNMHIVNLAKLDVIAGHSINGEILQSGFLEEDITKLGILYRPDNSTFNLVYQLYNIEVPKMDSENSGSLTNVITVDIPLDKRCASGQFTRLQDKILLHCEDKSVMLFNIEQNVLYSLHSTMPVSHAATNPLDGIFVTCNSNGRISIYDYAFNNIPYEVPKNEIYSHFSQLNFVLLSSNGFRMKVKKIEFLSSKLLLLYLAENKLSKNKIDNIKQNIKVDNTFYFFLVSLPYKINSKILINQYLNKAMYEEALNVLKIINWNCSPNDAYYCLNRIFQHLIQLPLNGTMENHIEQTLASFLIPMTPIDFKIFEQHLPYIRYLAIRFFYRLIEDKSYQKAFQLAIELKSRRLFLLLHDISNRNGLKELSISCYKKAQTLL